MPKLRKISSETCVKILCNKFSFHIVRHRGSHIILKKEMPGGKIGTLKSILKLAKIDEEEFSNYT